MISIQSVNHKEWGFIAAIFIAALILRLISMPSSGFFCDVPAQIKAIESNNLIIQFPGYAPYHFLIAGLASLTASTWQAMLFFSMLCGMLSILYLFLAAKKLAGSTAAVLSGGVMAFAVLPVYFSVAGTSYATEMLFMAGIIYHGISYSGGKKQGWHFGLLLFWLFFGIMMRPPSAVLAIPAVNMLLIRNRDYNRAVLLSFVVLFAALAYFSISSPFYTSFQEFIDSAGKVFNLVSRSSFTGFLTNTFRLIMYPVYSFHIWLLFCLAAFFSNREKRTNQYFLFIILLAAPYLLVLVKYIPHAGYYCPILPVIALFPWTLTKSLAKPVPGNVKLLSLLFVLISLFQFLWLEPVRTKGLGSGIANAYFLQYSRSGLKQGYFETLSTAMFKAGEEYHRLIPENTRKELRKQNNQ